MRSHRWCNGAENGIFFVISLSLSRACLGKVIVFIYKWVRRCGKRVTTTMRL
jgi:hypothetical protein